MHAGTHLQVGHVGAMYGAFLAMMMAAGVPTTLAAMTLGYSANLFGALTHYASGPAVGASSRATCVIVGSSSVEQ
jgi:hypothetical protein